jgi:tetratricopeptide (TPR) repeat protein
LPLILVSLPTILIDHAFLLFLFSRALLTRRRQHRRVQFRYRSRGRIWLSHLRNPSVSLNPEYWAGYNNIISNLTNSGDVEGAIRVGKQMMQLAGGRPGKAAEDFYGVYDLLVYNLQAQRSAALADIERSGGGTGTASGGAAGLSVAWTDVLLHEPDTARLRLQTTVWDEQSLPDAAAAAFARAQLSEELGEFAAAASAWDAYAKAYEDPVIATGQPWGILWSAVTYEKTGQSRKADAALNAVGALTFPECYAFRADVLDLRGDWAGAQTWYAKAVKLAPSFPGSYYSWGLALARYNDLQGAVEQLRIANLKGPTWADPLKAWGDVLVKMGNPKEAVAKYDEALKYAPNWKQLKEAREAISKQKR